LSQIKFTPLRELVNVSMMRGCCSLFASSTQILLASQQSKKKFRVDCLIKASFNFIRRDFMSVCIQQSGLLHPENVIMSFHESRNPNLWT